MNKPEVKEMLRELIDNGLNTILEPETKTKLNSTRIIKLENDILKNFI